MVLPKKNYMGAGFYGLVTGLAVAREAVVSLFKLVLLWLVKPLRCP